MSIADKLTYLQTTKQLLKTEINKINNVLDDNSTFRSYPEELFNGYLDILNNGTDTLWNNLEKVSASGEEATLENVETAPIKMVLNGNTSQDGTPTPDTPVEVKVVKGENVVSVSGKNLFPINNIDLTLGGVRVYTQDGIVILNGTATSNVYETSQSWQSNMLFNLKKGTYTLSLNTIEPHQITLRNKTTGDVLARVNGGTILNATFTLEEDAEVYLGFYLARDTIFNNLEYKIQLEEGTAKTDFVPYSKTDYPINLGDIELCKINTYKDYFHKDSGKWYVHKAIGKVVLDGSENWSKAPATTGFLINNFPSNRNNNVYEGYSNFFTCVNTSTTWQGLGKFGWNTSNTFWLQHTTITEVSQLRDWIQENAPTVYYVLATPTDTEITNTTLIEQLEAISKAKSVKDKTYITQTNDDLPFILDVEAIKEYEVN